ncbi:hypothetical protein MASR2M79_01080 [Aminivibrio sp.]
MGEHPLENDAGEEEFVEHFGDVSGEEADAPHPRINLHMDQRLLPALTASALRVRAKARSVTVGVIPGAHSPGRIAPGRAEDEDGGGDPPSRSSKASSGIATANRLHPLEKSGGDGYCSVAVGIGLHHGKISGFGPMWVRIA